MAADKFIIYDFDPDMLIGEFVGTISFPGDVTIGGDLDVAGSVDVGVDETVQGQLIIDTDNAEALLVRKDGDTGDVFVVDTVNSKVGVVTTSPFTTLTLPSGSDSPHGYIGWDYVSGQANSRRWWMANDYTEYGDFAILTETSQGSASPDKIRLRINPSGDVSIPAGALTVSGTGDTTIAGNVGIGTTSPEKALDVAASSSTDAEVLRIYNSNESIAVTQSANLAFGLMGSEDGGSSYSVVDAAKIIAHKTGDFVASSGIVDQDAELQFHTIKDGSLTQKMVIDESGNVGIGTTTPSTFLEVAAGTTSTIPVIISRNAPSNAALLELEQVKTDRDAALLFTNTGGNQFIMGLDASDSDKFKIADDNDDVSVNTRLTIDSSGNVGIGTTSPSEKLDVAGNINIAGHDPKIYINDTTGGGGQKSFSIRSGYSDDGMFQIWDDTANANRLAIDTSGKVGIGTASPASIFHVNSTQSTPIIESSTDTDTTIEIKVDGSSKYKFGYENSNGNFDIAGASFSTNKFLSIDSSGNVGIGTSSPEVKFHIEGTTDADWTIKNTGDGPIDMNIDSNVTAANDNLAYIRSYWDGNEVSRIAFRSGDDNTNKDDGSLRFFTAPAGGGIVNRMEITQEGNIGIGTDTPATLLEISGGALTIDDGAAATPSIRFASDTNTGIYRAGGDQLGFAAAGGGKGLVASTGFRTINGTAANPSYSFINDVDTGLNLISVGNLGISLGASNIYAFTTTSFSTNTGTNRPVMFNLEATNTVPVLVPSRADTNTGIGWNAADELSLVAGGSELLRLSEDTTSSNLLIPMNNIWLSQTDNAGTGTVNMFKVNASDEIEVGATLNLGTLESTEDSGAITLWDMPVSSTPTSGDEMSASFSIDSDVVFKVYAEADGTGGVQNHSIDLQNHTLGGSASDWSGFGTANIPDSAAGYITVMIDGSKKRIPYYNDA